jgi:hypothetical protein
MPSTKNHNICFIGIEFHKSSIEKIQIEAARIVTGLSIYDSFY